MNTRRTETLENDLQYLTIGPDLLIKRNDHEQITFCNLESLSPEELDALAAVADQMDAEAAAGVPADVTPEDVALEKDREHNDTVRMQTEQIKLDTVQEIREKFSKIWEGAE